MNIHYKNIAIEKGLLLVVLSTITILIGGLIYILFRPNESIFFEWIRSSGFEQVVTNLRNLHPTVTTNIPEWIVYSLPNGLWAFSYAALITHIWWNKQTILKTIWLTTIPLLVFGYEFLQLTKIISGTFCFQDLCLGALGIVSGIMVGILTAKK